MANENSKVKPDPNPPARQKREARAMAEHQVLTADLVHLDSKGNILVDPPGRSILDT